MANAQSISISIGKRGTTVTGAMLDEYPDIVANLEEKTAQLAAIDAENDVFETILDGTYVEPEEENNGGAE